MSRIMQVTYNLLSVIHICVIFFRVINGNTALHYAAYKGNLEMVMLLISEGCEVNVEENVSYTWYITYDSDMFVL
jgi:ankyrin repeat protein